MSKPRIYWTPELDELLVDVYPHCHTGHIACLLGCGVGCVHQRAQRLGLAKTREAVALASAEATRARGPWTDTLLDLVELMYPVMRTEDLAALIGKHTRQIHAVASGHGWRKERDLVAQMARERMTPDHPASRHQFQKGIVPWNTGLKGICHPASVPTQFKAGNRPHTWKPIGSLRINADGYLDRKVSDTGYPPRDWVSVHRLVWMQVNGPVPPSHVITFKPGRRTTNEELITIDVVECVHRGEMAKRNHPRAISPELGRITTLRAVMSRMINKRQRESEAATGAPA